MVEHFSFYNSVVIYSSTLTPIVCLSCQPDLLDIKLAIKFY